MPCLRKDLVSNQQNGGDCSHGVICLSRDPLKLSIPPITLSLSKSKDAILCHLSKGVHLAQAGSFIALCCPPGKYGAFSNTCQTQVELKNTSLDFCVWSKTERVVWASYPLLKILGWTATTSTIHVRKRRRGRREEESQFTTLCKTKTSGGD